MMIVEDGKCPLCGNFGNEVDEKIFHCKECSIAYNEFYISFPKKMKPIGEKVWN